MHEEFAKQTQEFVRRMEGLSRVLPALSVLLQHSVKETGKQCNAFLEAHATSKDVKGTKTYSISPDHHAAFYRMDREFHHLNEARELLPPMFLVALVSQFDAHIGRLIRFIYTAHDEKMRSSKRRIEYSTLENLSTIQEAKDYLIERQIESVLRKSHSIQFEWMEKLLGCKLTHNLDAWPHFVELTERRNLFVHCDGVVSHQYLNVCKKHSSPIDPDTKAGSRLECPQKYFDRAYRTLYEIGIKLAQVIWRRYDAKNLTAADTALIVTTYDLICSKEYLIAIPLLEFAVAPTTLHSSAELKATLQLNLAQAYKWNNQADRCTAALGSVDWSDKEDKFKLGQAVLSNDFNSAETIMKKIGREGSITKTYYRDWPIFTDFRESEQFKRAFQEIFGEAFKKGDLEAKAPDLAPPK